MDDKIKAKLRCICGACGHDPYDTKCAYNKILAAKEPAEAQYEAVIKVIESVVKSNTKTPTKRKETKNAGSRSRTGRTKRSASTKR